MTHSNYRLLGDVRGERYVELLQAAGRSCDSVALVVRHDLPLSNTGQKLIDDLAPFLLSETERNEWPGTRLMGKTARCLTYRFGAGACDVIGAAAQDLYGWRQPTLPEDLSFYSGGDLWFFSISHERDSYFRLTQAGYEELRTRFPSCVDLLRSG